jgi:hypothetical protein
LLQATLAQEQLAETSAAAKQLTISKAKLETILADLEAQAAADAEHLYQQWQASDAQHHECKQRVTELEQQLAGLALLPPPLPNSTQPMSIAHDSFIAGSLQVTMRMVLMLRTTFPLLPCTLDMRLPLYSVYSHLTLPCLFR